MEAAHSLDLSGVDNMKLKNYIQKIERLEEEKKEISKEISDTYSEAKSEGFDTKVMREVIKLRKMEDDKLREQEMLVQTYMNALDT